MFLDESFRTSRVTGHRFGALCGVAVPDAAVRALQAGVYAVRRPYHDTVLRPEQEIRGKELLGNATFKHKLVHGFSYHYNLVEELLGFSRTSGFVVFGVVCFDPGFHTFACRDEHSLDKTYRCLFSRIDTYARRERPGELVELVFDDRDVQTNRDNAKAITNFLVRSPVGRRYDTMLPYPLFAVSQGHNYGLQLADVVTTVIAKRFEGDERTEQLWRLTRQMFYRFEDGGRRWSSLKVLRPPESQQ